ncbi:unnamed protein product [Acanthosepion pharaonis]|uniref:Uncharacterized protein n=1 Tax=Acanthosepion pharaonis TaxID=158019 RepID=A0A812EQT6_ACAPH|nr:unnamed protein product [Sepia pharaonis]
MLLRVINSKEHVMLTPSFHRCFWLNAADFTDVLKILTKRLGISFFLSFFLSFLLCFVLYLFLSFFISFLLSLFLSLFLPFYLSFFLFSERPRLNKCKRHHNASVSFNSCLLKMFFFTSFSNVFISSFRYAIIVSFPITLPSFSHLYCLSFFNLSSCFTASFSIAPPSFPPFSFFFFIYFIFTLSFQSFSVIVSFLITFPTFSPLFFSFFIDIHAFLPYLIFFHSAIYTFSPLALTFHSFTASFSLSSINPPFCFSLCNPLFSFHFASYNSSNSSNTFSSFHLFFFIRRFIAFFPSFLSLISLLPSRLSLYNLFPSPLSLYNLPLLSI